MMVVPIPDQEAPFPPTAELSGEEDDSSLVVFGDDVDFDGEKNEWHLWEIDIPLEPCQEVSALRAASSDESVLLVSESKKKKVEVKMSALSSEDQLRMSIAKHKEIGAWLKHSTVRRVARGKIPEHAIMRCRWILSWKPAGANDPDTNPKNGLKAKARLVVIGFEDPGVGVVANDSPTLSKDGRQTIIQQVCSYGRRLIIVSTSLRRSCMGMATVGHLGFIHQSSCLKLWGYLVSINVN